MGPLINLWAMRSEAKHQCFKLKQLKKIRNFKNLCLSLCRHLALPSAVIQSLREISMDLCGTFKEKSCPEPSKGFPLALSTEKDSVNNVESFKWIIVHGSKYLMDKCYMAVTFDEELPVFEKVCGILELNISFVVFDIIFLETVGFNDCRRAYEVRFQASGIVSVTPDMLPTDAPLHVYSFKVAQNSFQHLYLDESL